ncbi:MAG TPA: protoheme IX farnesyltransferase, partial [Novosphingobium sp.]
IPMLPVVAGEAATRRQIVLYSALLLPLSLVPCLIPRAEGGTGWIYAIGALALSTVFLFLAIGVGRRRRSGPDDRMLPEKRLFGWSVLYLFALFAVLVADRWLLGMA